MYIYICIYIRMNISLSLELTANAPEHGWLEDFSFPVGLFSRANMLVLGSVYIFHLPGVWCLDSKRSWMFQK